MYLFDYESFLFELSGHSDIKKREKYEKWKKISDAKKIEDEPFYEFLLKIDPIFYNVPQELKNDFDWDLLLRLVVVSFSSDYNFIISENTEIQDKPEFEITVKTEQQQVVKLISELWSFQILRLFEIYVEEQMDFYMLMMEDETECELLKKEREKKLNFYKINRIKILNKIRKKSFFD